eukprot:8937480-Alexandrium_andersonii.AAC.1
MSLVSEVGAIVVQESQESPPGVGSQSPAFRRAATWTGPSSALAEILRIHSASAPHMFGVP